jgi:2-polyprenyl-6-methoxyphenol hydroxylase-like FAD-dependent oxidoreductase
VKIIIVGGGISGLATALSLHQAGFQPQVFEAVTKPQPLGVGINVLPHATRELEELGLLDELRGIGVEAREQIYLTKHGRELWREPRGVAAGYRWPQISIHRGDLHMYLLRKTIERLGEENVRLGAGLVDLETRDDGVTAWFTDRATGRAMEPVHADLLIGADGIHSAVRKKFYPNEGPPQFSGSILWRAVVEAEPFLDGRSLIWAGHARQKLVAYPIRHDPETGKALINLIFELRGDPAQVPAREDWNKAGDKADFLPAFAGWNFPLIDVPTLGAATKEVFEFPMVDRDPLPRWTFGRTTLLGDAAHPMYPVGSNGATQGIIDARAFAFHMATQPTIDAALLAYEDERRPVTARIVEMNRANGPDEVMEIADQRAPNAGDDLDALLPMAERKRIADDYKKVAGFSPATLNERKSYSAVRIPA